MANDTATYVRHRDHTISVHRTDDGTGEIGDFHAGVAEWELESGASLRTAAMAEEFGRRAIDRHLDVGINHASCLVLSGASPLPLTQKGLVVESPVGEVKIFYNAIPEDEEDDPYLQEVGWYLQSLDDDMPPDGPHATHEAAIDAAMALKPARSM